MTGVRIYMNRGVAPAGAVLARKDSNLWLVIDPDLPRHIQLELIQELLDGEIIPRQWTRRHRPHQGVESP